MSIADQTVCRIVGRVRQRMIAADTGSQTSSGRPRSPESIGIFAPDMAGKVITGNEIVISAGEIVLTAARPIVNEAESARRSLKSKPLVADESRELIPKYGRVRDLLDGRCQIGVRKPRIGYAILAE